MPASGQLTNTDWPLQRMPNCSAVLLLVLAGVWLAGGRCQPADLHQLPQLLDAQNVHATARTYLRIGFCDIDQGRGPDGQVDLGRTARCLQGFDLLVLQHVRGASWVGPDQLQSLGRSLAQASVFVPTVQQFWTDRQGYGMLSRLPIEPREVIPLGSPEDDVCGSVLLAKVELGGQPVNVLTASLHADCDRQRQVARLVDCFLKVPAPAVLVGDLDLDAGDEQLARLQDSSDVTLVAPAPSESGEPSREADGRRCWLVLRGLDTGDSKVQPTPLARAPLLQADVKLR